MTELLSGAWVEALSEASADRQSSSLSSSPASVVVAITMGKTKAATFRIAEGRVVGAAEDDEPAVTVPVTAEQLAALVDGSESMAQAYMRGDLKPEGATGALLALIELWEDATFRRRLAEFA